jgi:phosphopentomutase
MPSIKIDGFPNAEPRTTNGKVCLIVLDGCGCGELPDAAEYNDSGTNTLKHVLDKTGVKLPNLSKLGLLEVVYQGAEEHSAQEIIGNYGKMRESAKGKDTTTGHWEISGLVIEKPFPLYPNGFPDEVIVPFEKVIGRKVLGNKPASGTEIIKELGEEHVLTGKPIIYTSADSVFQIAAHVDVISVEELYEICKKARNLLQGKHRVVRVIARPFDGNGSSDFKRISEKRRDFSVKPFKKTLLDFLNEKEIEVHATGKISEIFAGEGISHKYKTGSNEEGMAKTLELVRKLKNEFIFTNLVDFDMLWGHRNDYRGYGRGLAELDNFLPVLMDNLAKDDILIITSDHGCDPTSKGTDHTREYVPLLVYGKNIKAGVNLGIRQTFSDVGQTIADYYKINLLENGISFLEELCLK